jgi:hypothetical protein
MASSIETTSTTTTLKNNGNTYLSVDTNDVVALNNPLPLASGGTGGTTSATAAAILAPIQLQTAVATTSGTTKDFTGIPAGVNKITVTYNGVSDNGTSVIIAQLGTSGIVTSGYVATATHIAPSTAVLAVTAGFPMTRNGDAAALFSGILHLVRHTGNEWVGTAMSNDETNTQVHFGAGKIALAGEVDALRLTTVGGQTFDAGSVNISWEF